MHAIDNLHDKYLNIDYSETYLGLFEKFCLLRRLDYTYLSSLIFKLNNFFSTVFNFANIANLQNSILVLSNNKIVKPLQILVNNYWARKSVIFLSIHSFC